MGSRPIFFNIYTVSTSTEISSPSGETSNFVDALTEIVTKQTMTKTYPQLELDYDVTVPQIQCDADKQGARIFLVPSIDTWTYDDVRVLAFDKVTAVRCGRQYAVERDARITSARNGSAEGGRSR